MKLYVAGGCSEHGRNCFYVQKKNTALIVDCGIMKENPAQPYPRLSRKQIASADYLFLTHCHADHAGALLWLYENGFRGKVIASGYTLQVIPGKIKGAKTLEKLGKPLKKIRLEKGLSFVWGRSGHCIGSVWLEFSLQGKKILFTGDYTEKSSAYRCDAIRRRKAETAVIDCAYGNEETDAADHLLAFGRGIDEAAASGKAMLFPVPMYGRGFDIIRMLSERVIPVYLNPVLMDEVSDRKEDRFWLRKGMRKVLKETVFFPEEAMASAAGTRALLVTDSQLADERNRETALRTAETGGRVILTGKQEPAGFSRMLLDSGKAEFLRLSVHQNVSEMKRLAEKNSFGAVLPFHCRQRPEIKDKKYVILNAGERY